MGPRNYTQSEDYEDIEISERGPWSVDIWKSSNGGSPRVILQSDDFTHDAALEISGDFISLDQKVKYARLLATRMNKMPME